MGQKYINWTTEWTKVVFSNEKKFNFDGPDGLNYYWHDLKKEPKFNYSRNFVGGTLIVWVAFSMLQTCRGQYLLFRLPISRCDKLSEWSSSIRALFVSFNFFPLPILKY